MKTTEKLIIKLSLLEKILSIHGDLELPFERIVSIKKEIPPHFKLWFDLRLPGTFLPGVVKMGTYYSKRGKEFWLWTRGKKYEYTIELKSDNYKRVVLSLDKQLKVALHD